MAHNAQTYVDNKAHARSSANGATGLPGQGGRGSCRDSQPRQSNGGMIGRRAEAESLKLSLKPTELKREVVPPANVAGVAGRMAAGHTIQRPRSEMRMPMQTKRTQLDDTESFKSTTDGGGGSEYGGGLMKLRREYHDIGAQQSYGRQAVRQVGGGVQYAPQYSHPILQPQPQPAQQHGIFNQYLGENALQEIQDEKRLWGVAPSQPPQQHPRFQQNENSGELDFDRQAQLGTDTPFDVHEDENGGAEEDDEEEEEMDENIDPGQLQVVQNTPSKAPAAAPIAPLTQKLVFNNQKPVNTQNPLLNTQKPVPNTQNPTPIVSYKKPTPAAPTAPNLEAQQKCSATSPSLPSSDSEIPPPATIQLTKATKRTHDEHRSLDYDLADLKKQTYASLDAAPYTTDPRAPHPKPAVDAHGVPLTLPGKLANMSRMQEGDIRAMFESQTDREREETGTWFMEDILEKMKRVEELRVKRRMAALEFEMEVRRRLKVVEVGVGEVEAKLKGLKKGGGELIGRKNVDGGKELDKI